MMPGPPRAHDSLVWGFKGALPGGYGRQAARLAVRGGFVGWLESVGMIQPYWGIELNELVVSRLQYLSRFGVLLWDIVGSTGMADVQQEDDLLQSSRPALLVANVLFAVLVGVCCALLGTVGPALAMKEPQLWTVAILYVAWLAYAVGVKPYVDLAVTMTEAMLATGQTLLAFCSLLSKWEQEQPQGQVHPKANLVAVCGLAGMVLLLTVVQVARLFVLLLSVWHAWQYGGRRLRRVVPAAG